MKRCLILLVCLLFVRVAAVAAVYDNLFVVGDACSAGWNPAGALIMTRESDNSFSWKGVLKANSGAQERFKLLVAREWKLSLTADLSVAGHRVLHSGVEADLHVKFETDGKPDNAFQVLETGGYSLRVNTSTMKMSCAKLSDYEEPDYSLFSRQTFAASSGEVLNYRLLAPAERVSGTKYPLVIFLHGAGERGNDNTSQLTYGGDLFLKRTNRESYPAYVLFPQCPSRYFWPFDAQPPLYDATTFPIDYAVAPAIQQVHELILSYLKRADVDAQRVYVVGISMGGMGTYDLVCRYPELFAAAVPVCGGVNVERLRGGVKEVHWRLFHGDADGVVTVKNSRSAYAKLMSEGADVQYVEFAGVDHFSWTNVFMQEDFMEWIFLKKRPSASAVEQPEALANGSMEVTCKGSVLCVNTLEMGEMRVGVYTTSGVLLHTLSDGASNGGRTLRVLSLPELGSGVYVLQVQVGSAHRSVKIVR